MANTKQPLPAGRCAVELAIVARGSTSLTGAELAAIRLQSLDQFPTPLRPQFLKHSDDQTLAALTALAAAIQAQEMTCQFHDWAVISATRYLGRAAFAAVIDKYQIDGPWGVSVQVIPHTAPHALAGTVSLALGSHGPSIGAGAARGEEPQALLAAATLLETRDIRGAWILLTGWSASQDVLEPTQAASEVRCAAAALAVVSADAAADHRSIGRIVIDACPSEQAKAPSRGHPVVAPLTELLAGDAFADLWEGTCRGMRTRVELMAAELLPSEVLVVRAA